MDDHGFGHSYLYKPIRKTFPRSKVVVNTIDSMWDGDLADVSNIASHNDGYKFLLVLIDIFSRFLFIVPLKNKQNQTIIEGLKSIFQKGRKPHTLRTDKGSEFKNRWVKTFLKKEGINVIYTQNETKANYAERVIRTMKNLMYRYFMKNRTYHYVNVLQDLVNSYNKRPHRSLGSNAPASVNQDNADEIRLDAYLSEQKKTESDVKFFLIMAKEMILVPKLKYDRLLEKVDQKSEQLLSTDTQETPNSITENQNVKDSEDNTVSLLQSGSGYVSKKKNIGKPPGIPDVRRKKKKNIPWLTY